jgi:hypothetical protein
MFTVFINGFGVDQNIINIDNSEMAERIKNVIHNVLELTRGILKAKRHNIPLVMSKRSGKGSLVPILFSNLDFPKSRLHI